MIGQAKRLEDPFRGKVCNVPSLKEELTAGLDKTSQARYEGLRIGQMRVDIQQRYHIVLFRVRLNVNQANIQSALRG